MAASDCTRAEACTRKAGVGASALPALVLVSVVQQGSVVATYLHGPVLARNPMLADLLLSRAVGHPLPPLAPTGEEQRP